MPHLDDRRLNVDDEDDDDADDDDAEDDDKDDDDAEDEDARFSDLRGSDDDDASVSPPPPPLLPFDTWECSAGTVMELTQPASAGDDVVYVNCYIDGLQVGDFIALNGATYEVVALAVPSGRRRLFEGFPITVRPGLTGAASSGNLVKVVRPPSPPSPPPPSASPSPPPPSASPSPPPPSASPSPPPPSASPTSPPPLLPPPCFEYIGGYDGICTHASGDAWSLMASSADKKPPEGNQIINDAGHALWQAWCDSQPNCLGYGMHYRIDRSYWFDGIHTALTCPNYASNSCGQGEVVNGCMVKFRCGATVTCTCSILVLCVTSSLSPIKLRV